MRLSKEELLKNQEIGWEIVNFVNYETNVYLDNKVINTNDAIFSPSKYPFDMSFDELLTKLDYLFEDKNTDDIYDELGENFIDKYNDYINNTIYPIYKKFTTASKIK